MKRYIAPIAIIVVIIIGGLLAKPYWSSDRDESRYVSGMKQYGVELVKGKSDEQLLADGDIVCDWLAKKVDESLANDDPTFTMVGVDFGQGNEKEYLKQRGFEESESYTLYVFAWASLTLCPFTGEGENPGLDAYQFLADKYETPNTPLIAALTSGFTTRGSEYPHVVAFEGGWNK